MGSRHWIRRWGRIGLLALVLIWTAGCRSGDEPDAMARFGLTLEGIERFQVKKEILREGRENTFRTILAEHDGTVLKIESIENIEESAARQYIGERKYAIFSLFQNVSSAYPGTITNTVDSPDRFKPVPRDIEVNGEMLSALLLFSSERLTYGAAAEDLVKYRGAVTFLYRPAQRAVYRIDIFVPKERYSESRVLEWLQTLRFPDRGERPADRGVSSAPAPKPERPAGSKVPVDRGETRRLKGRNLIIIAFEPLGANHVGAYGYPQETTPCLDRFSEHAFRFQHAISPSSWTLPAFMSWFTSLYPSQHKVVNKYMSYKDESQKKLSSLSELSPGVETLAAVLRANGYATAGFTGGAALSGHFGYEIGFDEYRDEATFGGFDLSMPQALAWLQTHRDEKFFLFVQGFDVHGRYPPPAQKDRRFTDPGYGGRFSGSVEEYWQLRNQSVDDALPPLSPEDVRFWKANYDAKIHAADRKFGAFIQELEALGLMDDSIIVVSSGSGNEFCQHGKIDHGFSLYEELIRVPLLIKVPGQAGAVITDQVRTLDIMPTALDLLSIDPGERLARQIQGTSLVALMTGQSLDLDAFAESDYLLQVFKRAIRTNDGWKFIYSIDSERRELYNLSQDPGERENRVDADPKMAYELEQRLFKHMAAAGSAY